MVLSLSIDLGSFEGKLFIGHCDTIKIEEKKSVGRSCLTCESNSQTPFISIWVFSKLDLLVQVRTDTVMTVNDWLFWVRPCTYIIVWWSMK